jgi:ABC-type siderophore export system fused ATPase/permease subunit
MELLYRDLFSVIFLMFFLYGQLYDLSAFQFASPTAVSLMQAKSGHEPTEGLVP